jgi:large subunit ribosomal protein L28
VQQARIDIPIIHEFVILHTLTFHGIISPALKANIRVGEIIACERGSAMANCDMCGKGPQFGHNISHSKRHTNRMWSPNIQPVSLMVNGQLRRVRVCTRCLRTLNKTTA